MLYLLFVVWFVWFEVPSVLSFCLFAFISSSVFFFSSPSLLSKKRMHIIMQFIWIHRIRMFCKAIKLFSVFLLCLLSVLLYINLHFILSAVNYFYNIILSVETPCYWCNCWMNPFLLQDHKYTAWTQKKHYLCLYNWAFLPIYWSFCKSMFIMLR